MEKEQIAEEQAKLREVLLGEDELGRIIRSHLIVERHINQILDIVVPNPKFLGQISGYRQRVYLAVAHGLDEQFLNHLLKLGKIRNKAAHDVEMGLNKELTDEFYNAFSQENKETIAESLRRATHGFENGNPVGVKALSYSNLFVIMAITIQGALLAGLIEIAAWRAQQ